MDLSDAADGGASDLASAETPVSGGVLTRIAYGLGAAGLLGATLADSIAVTGRHIGVHLLGSIELVQAAVVLLATSAMLIATITGNHASVHIVTSRLSQRRAALFARFANLLCALTFLALFAGSLWIAAELWNGHERTELLHIPLRWLRAIWLIFALLIAAQFLSRALAKATPQ